MLIKRQVAPSRVEMQMTPMIDMVFQLLIYFLFTFRITTAEGDLQFKMPLVIDPPPPLSEPLEYAVRLVADAGGNLREIVIPGRTIAVTPGDRASVHAGFASLQEDVKRYVGQDTGPNSLRQLAACRISADYHLHYQYTVDAISAVTAYREPGGQLVRLMQTFQLEQPKRP